MSIISQPPALNTPSFRWPEFERAEATKLHEEIEEIRRREKTIKLGSKGAVVEWIQKRLNSWLGSRHNGVTHIVVSGHFDQKTADVLELFQKHTRFERRGAHVLAVDRIVGHQSIEELLMFDIPRSDLDRRAGSIISRASEKQKVPRRPSEQELRAIVATFPARPEISEIDTNHFQQIMERHTYNRAAPKVSAREFLDICRRHDLDPTLALAVANIESHVGTNGAVPAETKNICNVGNSSRNKKLVAKRTMKSWQHGFEEFAKLVSNDYGKTAESVIANDFRRMKKGGRYGEAENYSIVVAEKVKRIRELLAARESRPSDE